MIKTLHFQGDFKLISKSQDNLFNQELAAKGGVYLWTYETEDGYIIDYVGEASSIKDRFYQHLREQLNGRYSIYDPDSLRNGKREITWKGYHWRSDEYYRVIEFISNSEKYMPKLEKMLEECRIFFAPIEGDELIRKRIEASILNEMSRLVLYDRIKPIPLQQIRQLQAGEVPVETKLVTDEKIIGLGDSLKY
jgi:hypothetical protein